MVSIDESEYSTSLILQQLAELEFFTKNSAVTRAVFKLEQQIMEKRLVIKKSSKPWPKFDDFTFLFPSVSVGNVGQLAVDLLITTLNATKIGILHHSSLLPVIGHDPYNSQSLDVATAADFYLCEEQKLLILQIRSPIIKAEKKNFVEDLASWVQDSAFRGVVILSSCHAQFRRDVQMTGSQFRYLANELEHSDMDKLRDIGAIELEEREDVKGVMKKYIPGAGFMYRFLSISKIPTMALMKFVDEGDNTSDAFSLVSYLNDWTKYKETNSWKAPFSWKNLYGSPAPASLY